MRILLSETENMLHVYMSFEDAVVIRKALRKDKSPNVKEFRSELKKVLDAKR